MARKARVINPDGLYHIYFKGAVNIFRQSEDFDKFLSLFDDFDEKTEVFAYGLTKNDGHFFMKTHRISLTMKNLFTDYAMWFNKKYNREGAVFTQRYKSTPVSMEYAAGLSRYIIQNKKRSGCSEAIRTLFESEAEFESFMKSPETETYGGDKGKNTADIKLKISTALMGKEFLQHSISDRARIVKKLTDFGISKTTMAEIMGVSRSTLINCLNEAKRIEEKRRREEIIIL